GDRRAGRSPRPSRAAGPQSEDLWRDFRPGQRRPSHGRFDGYRFCGRPGATRGPDAGGRPECAALGRRAGIRCAQTQRAMIATMRCVTADGALVGARVTRPNASDRSGGRALLFVHGVGSTAAIWDAQLAEFGAHLTCAAIELRGNGAVKPDPDPSSIARSGFAQDVLTVADALGVERFTLVGCSLGGVVAFELWKGNPERFDAMLVLGSFARYPNGQRYADGIASAARAAGSMRVFAERRA